ncbi:UNVERIFIED_CONTAM: putative plastid-lipid-associated protein 13, chloroplastic [Sesamum indicum]
MVFLLEFAAAFALLKWRNAHSDSALAPAENSSSLSTTPLHFSQLYYKKWIRLTDFPLCIPLVVDNLTGLGRVLISMSTFSIVPRKLETDSATISCGKSTIWLQSQLTKVIWFKETGLVCNLLQSSKMLGVLRHWSQEKQRIDVNERIVSLERLNPTPRPTTLDVYFLKALMWNSFSLRFYFSVLGYSGGTFERLFMISYLDEEILIIRDTAGVPEVLRRLDPGPSQTV